MWFIIIILIAVIIYQKINQKNILSQRQNETQKINYNEEYEKKEYLLTPTELKFYKVLKNITNEQNLLICPQVALYEIIQNKDFKDFNRIASKTIDFVITEPNLRIKFCIELDDYSHNQPKRKKRDAFVNKLFNDTNVKLIRIPVQNYYNKEELKNIITKGLA